MGQGKRLANFLVQYRNAPHATTQMAPAQLMFGRRLRTRLDLIIPSEAPEGPFKEEAKAPPKRTFLQGKGIWFPNFSKYGSKWEPGTVVTPIGNVMYEVRPTSQPNCILRRHIDQLYRRDNFPTPDA